MDEKVKLLVKTLIDKAKSKNTIWNTTSSDGEYKLIASNGLSLTIGYFSAFNNEEEYILRIYNKRGDVIVSETTDTLSAEESELISQLHKHARSSYYNAEETIESFLNILNEPGIVGEQDINTMDPNEDDLPF